MGLVVGTGLGVIAGAFAGRVESLLMRFVDVLLSIPSLLLSLTVIILLGFGTVNAAIAVGVASIASFARLARGESCVSAIRIMSKRRSAAAGRFSPCCGDTFCPTR